jgi:ornithine cyclodeaminase/alanine dehydrogenase-like protein (mu-crystallin family)
MLSARRAFPRADGFGEATLAVPWAVSIDAIQGYLLSRRKNVLFLSNEDVAGLISVEECVALIDEAYEEMAAKRAAQYPEGGRMDVVAPSPGPEEDRRFTWGAMAGVVPKFGMFALRMKFDIHYSLTGADGGQTSEKYCREPGTYCGLIMLATIDNAEPVAILKDGILQHLRVGATAGIAAKHLARDTSRTIGMLGSGGMARTYSAAYCAVRPIERINVYSPTVANRERFAAEMTQELGVRVVAVDSPYEAVEGADIVADCTDASSPIFEDSDWLKKGMHIATFGANRMGQAVVTEADVVVRHFAGPSAVYADPSASAAGDASWSSRNPEAIRFDELPLLTDVMSGRIQGRSTEDQITCFYNVGGSAIQFAAIGPRIYQLAREKGLGTEVPTEMFLQDIRD